jgi:polysaccharide export outer membrane protein
MSIIFLFATSGLCLPIPAQEGTASRSVPSTLVQPSSHRETPQDYNQTIAELAAETKAPDASSLREDYQIGPEDLLEISVLEAPDLNRTVRVSDDGAISLALLGSIQVAGMSTRELQADLQDRLRRTYMKDPQVGVFVQEMRSHPVSVFGAVEKPGVYQIRYAKPLIEILSMAQGLANDAGDTVIVMRHQGATPAPAFASLSSSSPTLTTDQPVGIAIPAPGPSGLAIGESSATESITINLKDLLDSGNPRSNVLVYPGDLVKVSRAGIVYVVGQVHKPGGFVLKTNENISVLQAIALAEGVTPNAKGKEARIFVASGANEQPKEVAINLDKIMAGKAPAPILKPDDVLFIPNSAGKETLHVLEQSTAGIVGALGGAAIYRW